MLEIVDINGKIRKAEWIRVIDHPIFFQSP